MIDIDKVEVHVRYGGKLVLRLEAWDVEDAKARARRAGHRIARTTFDRGLVTISSRRDPDWIEIPMRELKAIWAAAHAERRVYNGHTFVDLVAKYGEGNVKHLAGVGFFRRRARAAARAVPGDVDHPSQGDKA